MGRFIRTKAPESAAKQAGGRHWYGVARAVSTSSSGGGAGSGAAQLFPVHYVVRRLPSSSSQC